MTPDLRAVRAQFEKNFADRGELGASVSVWVDGEEALALSAGWRDRQMSVPWTPDTLVLLWSMTKALAAACLVHALAADKIPLSAPVAQLWPEFAQSGKSAITLAQLLSHQAGLAAMDDPQPPLLDHASVSAALAAQAPNWDVRDGSHGYHARTYGFLLDELIRRMRPGTTLGRYWRKHFGEPLALDIWMGLPDEEDGRVANMYPARSTGSKPLDPFYDALGDVESLTHRAFAAPRGLQSIASMNAPEVRRESLPSLGAIGSACALGRFYTAMAREEISGLTLDCLTPRLASGPDRVLLHDTAFSVGFMLDPVDADGCKRRALFGPSSRAFGQPGAGGGHAFGDPDNGIAFAYVMNQMELGVLPNAKSLSMVAALYGGQTALA